MRNVAQDYIAALSAGSVRRVHSQQLHGETRRRNISGYWRADGVLSKCVWKMDAAVHFGRNRAVRRAAVLSVRGISCGTKRRFVSRHAAQKGEVALAAVRAVDRIVRVFLRRNQTARPADCTAVHFESKRNSAFMDGGGLAA